MSFSVTILGSSSALPTSKRFLSAHLLNVDEFFYLIDCGEGTQIQLRRLKASFGKINHIFISHLHGDHVFGLFGLISSFDLLGREYPLHIYAHSDLKTILRTHLDYFGKELNYEICFHAINPRRKTEIYQDKRLTVTTIPLKHRIPTCGFLFRENARPLNISKEKIAEYKLSLKEIVAIKAGADLEREGLFVSNEELTLAPYNPRTYAYITDTLPRKAVIPQIREVDLLYHEATYLHKDQKLAKKTFHTTAMQAAEIAAAAKAKKLLIGHYSSRYKHIEDFLTEARIIFNNAYLSEDGDKHFIELERSMY